MPNTPENNCSDYCTVTILQCRWCLQGTVVQEAELWETAQKRIVHSGNCDQIKAMAWPAYVVDCDAIGDMPNSGPGRIMMVSRMGLDELLEEIRLVQENPLLMVRLFHKGNLWHCQADLDEGIDCVTSRGTDPYKVAKAVLDRLKEEKAERSAKSSNKGGGT